MLAIYFTPNVNRNMVKTCLKWLLLQPTLSRILYPKPPLAPLPLTNSTPTIRSNPGSAIILNTYNEKFFFKNYNRQHNSLRRDVRAGWSWTGLGAHTCDSGWRWTWLPQCPWRSRWRASPRCSTCCAWGDVGWIQRPLSHCWEGRAPSPSMTANVSYTQFEQKCFVQSVNACLFSSLAWKVTLTFT